PMAITSYELGLVTSVDGAKIGKTKLVLTVGAVPPIRLRATPSLAHPGVTIEAELFRGPDYRGALTEKVILRHGVVEIGESPLDPVTRKASFVVPEGRHGFLHIDVGGARAVVFSRPRAPISVAVTSDKPAYRPGETATLTVTTRAGEPPTPA